MTSNELQDLLDAMEAVTHIAHFLTKNEVCDHDAGICWCGEKRMVADAQDQLAAHGRHP